MDDFAHIAACSDVSDDEMERSLAPARSFDEPSPRERLLALLAHMAKVATPNRGAPRLLVLAARAAGRDWLDGRLRVKLIGDHEVSVLELLVDDGVSRERIAGPLRVDVPLAEFGVALESEPELFEPLVATELEPRRIVLEQGASAQPRTGKLGAFASGLMRAVAGRTAPPTERPKPHAPRRARSIASFAKAAATLVFDEASGRKKPEKP